MGQRLRRHAERVASGQTPLLHRGRREGGKSDHVAHGIDVRDSRLIVLVDREPFAVITSQADRLEPELMTHTLPANGVQHRLCVQLFAWLQRGPDRSRAAVANSFLNLQDLFTQPTATLCPGAGSMFERLR